MPCPDGLSSHSRRHSFYSSSLAQVSRGDDFRLGHLFYYYEVNKKLAKRRRTYYIQVGHGQHQHGTYGAIMHVQYAVLPEGEKH